mmetsp:Transcript_30864/g.46851  ORF Transcript_30864/g.46851 Transcript_30864/m.46851 type:complete len:351 (+) Transcript_30864:74-1126(+)
MSKKHTADNSRRELSESIWDCTILSLGSILIVALAVFFAQISSLFSTLQYPSRPLSSAIDIRGVNRLIVGEDPKILGRAVAEFVDRNEPFVCRSCIEAKKLEFWNRDENLGEVVSNDTAAVSIRISQSKDSGKAIFARKSDISPNSEESVYSEQKMSFHDFLRVYDQPLENDIHYYGAQINVVESLPSLMPKIKASAPSAAILNAVGPTPSAKHRPLTLYIGKGPLTTQTHYDSLENLVCVVAGGTKTFDLYDPASSSLWLYVDRPKHGNASPVTTDNNNFPLSKFAIPSTATLHPGDCLYVPVYWYHSVLTSAHRTISINWWKRPDHHKMSVLEKLFCGREGELSRAKC